MSRRILVVGPAGKTGGPIVDALLKTPNVTTIGAVRPESATKPSTEELKAKGVEILVLDLTAPESTIAAKLLEYRVDTIISTIDWLGFQLQIPLINAAKEAGVKRFVPCDWGTVCKRGLREMYDEKLAFHDHIEKIGLGHTYIDVGWWMEGCFPPKSIESTYSKLPWEFDAVRTLIVDVPGGPKRTLVTARPDIGTFTARIVTDERTLGRYVIIWGEEVTQKECFDLAQEVNGGKLETFEAPASHFLAEKEIYKGQKLVTAMIEYLESVWIRGDNTLENAKKPEYGNALDARELYPDIKAKTLRECVKEVYGHA